MNEIIKTLLFQKTKKGVTMSWKIFLGLLAVNKIYKMYKENKELKQLKQLKRYKYKREIEKNYNENIEKRENFLEIIEEVKKVDFEIVEDELENNDINKLFLDEVIEKYTKKVKIIIENIDLFDDFATVTLIIKKPDFDILKYDLDYEFEEFKEEIKKSGITDDILYKMRTKMIKILKNEDIYYSEETVEVSLDKKNYEWKLSSYDNEILAYSISECENFISFIDTLRE